MSAVKWSSSERSAAQSQGRHALPKTSDAAGPNGCDMKRHRLSRSMSAAQFDNGYWYAIELKAFADAIGIPSANKLRKDELEKAIKRFLRTGTIRSPVKRTHSPRGPRDVDRGLRLDLPVSIYTNDTETKHFLECESRKLAPGLKPKSGARYRLNRWREQQLIKGVRLTYGGLVKQYVRLCQRKKRFAKIPHGRYINFMSEFLATERGATRQQAIQAWKTLKSMDALKTYGAWVRRDSH